jgi:hypothetical protein
MKRIVTLLLFLAYVACDEQTKPDECPSNIICTEEFVSLYTQILEEDLPVELESYRVENVENGETYTFENVDDNNAQGLYIVITDAEFNEVKKEGTQLRLVGTTETDTEFIFDFVVGHDCCHIIPLSGPFYQAD